MASSIMQLGLPTAEKLAGYRIWDSYFTPSHAHPGGDGSSGVIADIERSLPAVQKGQIEKLCYFSHVGIGTTSDPTFEKFVRSRPEVIMRPFKKWPEMLLGMIQLNPHDVPASLEALDRWMKDGPMLGV
jgi:hypothetical protein